MLSSTYYKNEEKVVSDFLTIAKEKDHLTDEQAEAIRKLWNLKRSYAPGTQLDDIITKPEIKNLKWGVDDPNKFFLLLGEVLAKDRADEEEAKRLKRIIRDVPDDLLCLFSLKKMEFEEETEEKSLGIEISEEYYQIVKDEWKAEKVKISPEFLSKIWGRKWRVRLARLYPMVKGLSEKKGGEYALALATTSAYKLSIYKSSTNIAKCYKWLLQAKALFLVDRFYYFNTKTDKADGVCRQYLLDKPIMLSLKHLAEDLHLDTWGQQQTTKLAWQLQKDIKRMKKTAANLSQDEQFQLLKQKAHIGNNYAALPTEVYKDEKIIQAAIYDKYPIVQLAMEYAEKNNELREDYQEHVIARINVRKSASGKNWSKIGFRTTNRLVNLKKHAEPNQKYSEREEALYAMFPQGYQEDDIKACVPKTTYAVNTGKWLDNEVDLYEEIWNGELKLSSFQEKYRENMKPLSLFFSFIKTAANAKAKLLQREYTRNLNLFIKKYSKNRLLDILDRMLKNFAKVLHTKPEELLGEQIFAYESFIEMYVLWKLSLDTKKKQQQDKVKYHLPVNVYDCMYTDKRVYKESREYAEKVNQYQKEALEIIEKQTKATNNKQQTNNSSTKEKQQQQITTKVTETIKTKHNTITEQIQTEKNINTNNTIPIYKGLKHPSITIIYDTSNLGSKQVKPPPIPSASPPFFAKAPLFSTLSSLDL